MQWAVRKKRSKFHYHESIDTSQLLLRGFWYQLRKGNCFFLEMQYEYFVAFTSALGGLLFGIELGIINQVLLMKPFLKSYGLYDARNTKDFTSDDYELYSSIIVASFLVGCVISAISLIFTTDTAPRKKFIFYGSVLFSIGGFLQGLAINDVMWMLIIGRLAGGLGVGVLSCLVPLYISEIASTEKRGKMTSLQQLMITVGIALANVINAILAVSFDNELQWRLALGSQGVFGIIMVFSVLKLPESPRFLVYVGRDAEALVALAQLRQNLIDNPVVAKEFKDIKESIEAQRKLGQVSWSDASTGVFRERMWIGIIIQMFQQWTGINAVMYYSSKLFIGMGFDVHTATTVTTTISSLVNVFGTFPGILAIEKYGRVNLLFIGGIGMSACMWGLFGITSMIENAKEVNPFYGIIGAILMYVYVVFFASSWGPGAWYCLFI